MAIEIARAGTSNRMEHCAHLVFARAGMASPVTASAKRLRKERLNLRIAAGLKRCKNTILLRIPQSTANYETNSSPANNISRDNKDTSVANDSEKLTASSQIVTGISPGSIRWTQFVSKQHFPRSTKGLSIKKCFREKGRKP